MIGGSNAFLVTANPKYLALPRSQQAFMLGKSKVENGRRLVANRHNEQGWYDWRPAVPQYPVNLWYMRFRKGRLGAPAPSGRLRRARNSTLCQGQGR